VHLRFEACLPQRRGALEQRGGEGLRALQRAAVHRRRRGGQARVARIDDHQPLAGEELGEDAGERLPQPRPGR
jgi:hypothetical protein